MDTRKLYRLHLDRGIYAVDPNYEVKHVYDETASGDLEPVSFVRNESSIELCFSARGPLRVKYRKAK